MSRECMYCEHWERTRCALGNQLFPDNAEFCTDFYREPGSDDADGEYGFLA